MAVMDRSKMVLKAAETASAYGPYVRRLMRDERLRDDLRDLLRAATHLYQEIAKDDSLEKLIKDDRLRKDVDSMLESIQKAGQRVVKDKKGTNWAAIAIVAGVAGAVAALLVYPRTRQGIQQGVAKVSGRTLHVVEDVQENAA